MIVKEIQEKTLTKLEVIEDYLFECDLDYASRLNFENCCENCNDNSISSRAIRLISSIEDNIDNDNIILITEIINSCNDLFEEKKEINTHDFVNYQYNGYNLHLLLLEAIDFENFINKKININVTYNSPIAFMDCTNNNFDWIVKDPIKLNGKRCKDCQKRLLNDKQAEQSLENINTKGDLAKYILLTTETSKGYILLPDEIVSDTEFAKNTLVMFVIDNCEYSSSDIEDIWLEYEYEFKDKKVKFDHIICRVTQNLFDEIHKNYKNLTQIYELETTTNFSPSKPISNIDKKNYISVFKNYRLSNYLEINI